MGIMSLFPSPIDHPRYQSFVFAQIRDDDACEVNEEEAIDEVLQKAVHLFYRLADRPEEGDLLESKSQTGERHDEQYGIEGQIDTFDLDIMLAFCFELRII